MWQIKYASAVPKNLGVGVNFRPCSAVKAIFSLDVRSPWYLIVAVGLSGILKGKQKLGVTFNSDKLGSIDFTKISKLTMCSA